MRAFRADLAGFAALLLFGLLPAAQAQIGPPVQLVPGPNAAPANTPAAPPASAVPAPSASQEGINETPLAPMDTSWAGTLSATNGALPRTMWAGTPRVFVAAALGLLQPTTSPVLQDLTRRLLLSDAVAPAGQDPAGGPSLAELRLDRLLAVGRVDSASLLDSLPRGSVGESFDRDSVELRFAANDVTDACNTVRDRVARYRDAWWDRALIACQALSGAYNQASLGLSVMEEQKNGVDPAFATLINAIDGHRARLEKLPDPSPMRMALLAAAKLPLPTDALATAGPAALAVWATSTKVPVQQRLVAAEKAAAFGALPPAALGVLYDAVQVSAAERAAALKNSRLPADARARAMLYQVALATNAPDARVTALTALLADARRRDAFVTMAHVVEPLVAEVQPLPAEQGFAGDAARVLLATGHADLAAPWIALANTPGVQLLAALGHPPAAGANASPLSETIMDLAARDASAGPRQADLLIALFSALGQNVDGVDLSRLIQPAHNGMLPGAALWLDQQRAATAGRLGEAVLTSIIVASAGERLSDEPVILAHVLAGLKAVGLEADARAMAVEAALDAGI